MLQIANVCPVHRTLESSINLVVTSLADSVASEATSGEAVSMELERVIFGRVSQLPSSAAAGSAGGEPMGFSVRQIFPSHDRRAIGPFTFVDHMGPADVRVTEAINVGPHPHIQLSTLAYLCS